MDATIFDIKEFGLHDGPGLRLTVFLKGCPLRCVWCHNPEGLTFGQELVRNENACRHCGLCHRPCNHPDCAELGACVHICPDRLVKVSGERYTPERLAERVQSYREFFGERGGVTFSGGEPLMQAEFIEQTMALLDGVRFGVETCACVPAEVFDRMMPKFHDRFVDMKHMDADTHRRLTGQDNALILRNIASLKASGLPFTVRIPLIPGVNDSAENLAATAAFLADAKDRVQVELLPYNPMTGAKYRTIGRAYNPPFDEKQKPNKDTSAFDACGIPCRAY